MKNEKRKVEYASYEEVHRAFLRNSQAAAGLADPPVEMDEAARSKARVRAALGHFGQKPAKQKPAKSA